MMKSMTGYSSIQFSDEKFFLDLSLRAVNGRFFDLKMHLPREYSFLESDIRKKVNKIIKRGSLDLSRSSSSCSRNTSAGHRAASFYS